MLLLWLADFKSKIYHAYFILSFRLCTYVVSCTSHKSWVCVGRYCYSLIICFFHKVHTVWGFAAVLALLGLVWLAGTHGFERRLLLHSDWSIEKSNMAPQRSYLSKSPPFTCCFTLQKQNIEFAPGFLLCVFRMHSIVPKTMRLQFFAFQLCYI